MPSGNRGALAGHRPGGSAVTLGRHTGGSVRRPILQPDLTAEGDRGVDFRVGLEERVERGYESSDRVSVEREACWYADQTVGRCAPAQRVRQQGSEVREVAGDDHSLFLGKRGEVDTIRTSSQVGALADGDGVVSSFAQLPGDRGGEMLVEEQLQAEIASWAERQVLSSRSLSACTRSIQVSISSRLAP